MTKIADRFRLRCHPRRGLSRTDVIALIISAIALASILTLILFQLSPHASITISMRDATNLRQVHQGMVLFAGESGGLYSRPGLMKPRPVRINDEQHIIPGRGEERIEYNTTDRMYSSIIALRYTSPALLVSPGEANPNVREMRDYDYDAYRPSEFSFWDDRFEADLERASHTSYAHLLFFGERKFTLWNRHAPGTAPLLSTRGPRDGVPDRDSFTCDRHGNWTGVIVRNDNSTLSLDHMTPPGLYLPDGEAPRPDNVFAMEEGPEGEDVILTFTLAIDETGPTIQHD